MLKIKIWHENMSMKTWTHAKCISFLLKGIVHQKSVLSQFTQPCVIPNLYDFLSSAENKRKCFRQIQMSEFLRKKRGRTTATALNDYYYHYCFII